MESPDYYISVNEAAELYGIDPKEMRREANNRGWEHTKYCKNRVAYDIDEVQEWVWGLDQKNLRKFGPRETCMRCGKKAVWNRRFCQECVNWISRNMVGAMDEHSVVV